MNLPRPDNLPKPEATPDNSLATKEESGELTENEYGFILDATLSRKRRDDPSVLSFIDNFIRCKNIAQASSEAGIHPSLGYKIRHYKDVANTIQKLIDKSSVKYGFDASEIMERTKEIVDFDPIQVQNSDGTYKSNLHDIAPEARRNIKKMKVKNLYNQVEDMNGMKSKILIGELIEYEFYDKLKAVELTGKEKEMFKNTTKVEHSVTKDMASILLESARRGKEKSLEYKDVIEVQGRERKYDDDEA